MTYTLLLLVRFGLAFVFGLAALAKLSDQAGTRRAVAEFGVPAALAGPLSRLVPAAELTVAGALLGTPSARLGALGALVLLVVFTAAVARNLAQGRTPDCNCFGRWFSGATGHSGPIGRSTLIRNAVLAGLCLWVVAVGPGAPTSRLWSWMEGRTALERTVYLGLPGLTALVVGLGRVVINLIRQQGRLLLRIDTLEAALGHHDGLPLGVRAPSFALPSLAGRTVTLEGLLAADQPVLLVFTDPLCAPCNALFPELGRWQREYAHLVAVVMVSAGDPDLNRAQAAEHRLGEVLLQRNREVAKAYRTTATPSAVLIGTDQQVESPVAAGADSIWRLLLRTPHAVTLRPRTGPGPRLSSEVEVYEELGT